MSAESIRMLAEAGCQIIVDDITEGGVPWFQDGLVAQAVDDVVRDFGVVYFTSAGNFGRNSYAADFRPVAAADLEGLPADLADAAGLVLHDFDPGPGIDVFQTVGIPAGLDSVRIVMQWDQPWEDNASDVDLYVFSADGTELLTRLGGSHQLDADPLLGGTLPIPPGLDAVQLVVAHAGGAVFEDFDRNGSQTLGERSLAGEPVFLDLNGNGQLDRAPAAGATRAYVGFQSTASAAIGIRTLIANPNSPSTGPLQQPFTANAAIDVSGLPGAVTDLGVVYTLQSDQVVADQAIGRLFATLISPSGVRVPLEGSLVLGDGTPANGFTAYPLLPALVQRVISPTDQLRWVPPAGAADGQTAFSIVGWDGIAVGTGLSEVGFEPTPA